MESSGVGCSNGPPQGTATGEVTFQGQPATEGGVQLYEPKQGIGVYTALDSSGAFTVDRPLPIGTYIVCVVPRARPVSESQACPTAFRKSTFGTGPALASRNEARREFF